MEKKKKEMEKERKKKELELQLEKLQSVSPVSIFKLFTKSFCSI